MNNGKEVYIKLLNIDRMSYVEKSTRCDACLCCTMDGNADACPIIKRIASEVTQTRFNISPSRIDIITQTYDHDFRRALDVVNQAINSRCHKR